MTDPAFARRVRDLIKHDELDLNNVELLKFGRYFRLSHDAKLIVGRDEDENGKLSILARDGDYLFEPASIKGPIAVGRGAFTPELIVAASRIVARYCDHEGDCQAEITYKRPLDTGKISIKTGFMDEGELAKLRV